LLHVGDDLKNVVSRAAAVPFLGGVTLMAKSTVAMFEDRGVMFEGKTGNG
jgi:hypothetical protein